MTEPKHSLSRQVAGHNAGKIVSTMTERNEVYGDPVDNFANIARFWNAWIKARYNVDLALDGTDVGHMSSLMKKARAAQSPLHEDTALDDATYTLLALGVTVATTPITVQNLNTGVSVAEIELNVNAVTSKKQAENLARNYHFKETLAE